MNVASENHALRESAIVAARAGAAALAPFRTRERELGVSAKAVNDFVTAADLASENAVKTVLAERHPAHALLGEESGGAPLGDEPTWIIDPLDGTTNFIHDFGVYAVSIACAVRGQVVAGVILDPSRDELFSAARGGGAFLGERRLRVSERAGLDEALIATGFPFRRRERIDAFLAAFRNVFDRAAGIRRAGSAALDLAAVAAGRFDGFWEEGLGAWDIAAGTLLVEEAGGIVTDFAEGKDFLRRGDVVVGPEGVQRELLAAIEPMRAGQSSSE